MLSLLAPFCEFITVVIVAFVEPPTELCNVNAFAPFASLSLQTIYSMMTILPSSSALPKTLSPKLSS